MFSEGKYIEAGKEFGAFLNYTKKFTELILVKDGNIVSAYRNDGSNEYSYLSSKARDIARIIINGTRGCTSKNGCPCPCPELGSMQVHSFEQKKIRFTFGMHMGEIYSSTAEIGEDLFTTSYKSFIQFPEIPYIRLTANVTNIDGNVTEDVVVRSVEEIALEKDDLTWMQSKQYYIVNNDEAAEKIFTFLDNYNGPIAYDIESSGLRMNCFGKINSHYKKELEQYNLNNPDEQIRADYLVGIIFCVQDNISYYFPCSNRKFKNLYEEKDSELRRKICLNVKSRYTLCPLKLPDSDMARYCIDTPIEEWTEDVILMERCRNILETKYIVSHGGSFEWRTGWQYEIDTNIKDDTMILHQIMYKFRNTTSNRGEPSNLKYLAKKELGIDQWELSDFFPSFKEDNEAVRQKTGAKKKKKSNVDFSYMDYAGTLIYAPTDGDVTLLLYKKYKKDMKENHKDKEYIYNVEILTMCAIGYMEFYGHRIDEDKILHVKELTKARMAKYESLIRQAVHFSRDIEVEKFKVLDDVYNEVIAADDKGVSKEESKVLTDRLIKATEDLNKAIMEDNDNIINFGSPQQVADLFYDADKLNIPMQGDSRSVNKKVVKAYAKETDDEGNPKYPAVIYYSKYTVEKTLLQKFFDNLPYFMYPGGFIFSSYGQIAAATGRMSCSKPNAQQYPKDVTKIVIPRDDFIMMDADYSQIEYRVLVALSKNTKLAELFSDPDSDYHTLMASLMYSVPYSSVTPKMRGDAKSFNFGIPYGMGLGSLAILLTGKNTPQTRDEAAEKYELYFKDQPMTRKYFDNIKETASVTKRTLTLFNRERKYEFVGKDGKINTALRAAALRQAGNAVIQGTAADIFKISVARNFSYIRQNKLFGLFLITNMVHDEQLMEVNTKMLNAKRILRDVGINMQFKLDGFPPLYIGAGIGKSWGYAKGKMAEIHPDLLDDMSAKVVEQQLPIFTTTPRNPVEVTKEITAEVIEFRRQKVIKYLTNIDNFNVAMHPAIGGLINLQFNYGRDKDAKEYGLTDEQLLLLNTADFIKENELNVDAEWFKATQTTTDVEEDSEYDEEDEDSEDVDDNGVSQFSLIDESNVMYGATPQDIIKAFGTCVIEELGICGVDMSSLYYVKKNAIIDYLCERQCKPEDAESMEVVFLLAGNVLKRTGIYVKNVDSSALEARFKYMTSQPMEAVNG